MPLPWSHPMPLPRSCLVAGARRATAAGLALAASGCVAAPPAMPMFALRPAAEERRALLTTEAEGATWPWEVREDAPWSTFPRGDRPPAGRALHLDFHARPPEPSPPPGANKIYYRDGVAFTVRLVVGSAFAVLDRDATDGEAMVAFPPGAHDGWLARLGEPGGTLALTDPIFFRRETLRMETGPRDWVRLGAREVPFRWEGVRGPDALRCEPHGLTGFSTRWYGAAAPDVPPLPPAVADLEAPDELVAGTTGELTAVAAGPGGLPAGTTYRWHPVDPDGRALPTALTEEPRLTWLAPPAPGRYLFGLTVETPYFRATAPAPNPVRVRRELFIDSYGPVGRPWPDAAVSRVADTWPLTSGVAFDLAAEGTMNPWNAPDSPYCGMPEPAPMYPSPDRAAGTVAVDAAYFFASFVGSSACRAATFAVQPVSLLAFSADGGTAWQAPRPREGAYQPSHRYTYPAVAGAAHPLHVRITDPRVWDNYGRFKITIRRPG